MNALYILLKCFLTISTWFNNCVLLSKGMKNSLYNSTRSVELFRIKRARGKAEMFDEVWFPAAFSCCMPRGERGGFPGKRGEWGKHPVFEVFISFGEMITAIVFSVECEARFAKKTFTFQHKYTLTTLVRDYSTKFKYGINTIA